MHLEAAVTSCSECLDVSELHWSREGALDDDGRQARPRLVAAGLPDDLRRPDPRDGQPTATLGLANRVGVRCQVNAYHRASIEREIRAKERDAMEFEAPGDRLLCRLQPFELHLVVEGSLDDYDLPVSHQRS